MSFVYILFASVLFLIAFGAVLYIVINGKSAQIQNSESRVAGDETISDTVIITGATSPLDHSVPDIEPMPGMTNPSTGAVMINSLEDSTGHAYGL